MTDSRVWFKARTHGWGWGRATTWQGWLAYAAYVVLVAASAVTFKPDLDPVACVASVGGLTALLVGICWWKGETPRWRWGP